MRQNNGTCHRLGTESTEDVINTFIKSLGGTIQTQQVATVYMLSLGCNNNVSECYERREKEQVKSLAASSNMSGWHASALRNLVQQKKDWQAELYLQAGMWRNTPSVPATDRSFIHPAGEEVLNARDNADLTEGSSFTDSLCVQAEHPLITFTQWPRWCSVLLNQK